MTSFLVFNHHSLPFESKDQAGSAIPEFLKICIESQSIGLTTLLLDESLDKNWFRLQLSEGFFWQDWYHQNMNTENKDLIRAFRSIATRQPLFSVDNIGDDPDLFEVRLKGDDSYSALRAAVWYNAPVTSFPTRNPWNTSPLEVEANLIKPDTTLTSWLCRIRNFYSIAAFKDAKEEILKKRNLGIQTAKQLYEKRKDLYPFICFCGKTEQQLSYWSYSAAMFDQVKESLTALNLFCEKWHDGQFSVYTNDHLIAAGLNHKVSGESKSVLSNQALRREREFWLPTGNKKVFENHIKLSNGFRIHFFPDNESKTIFVGYIGPHLRLR